MTHFILWTFIAYGMTTILVWGSIFESTREWIKKKSKFFGDLISCPLCTSTWVGFFMSITIGGLSYNYLNTNILLGIFYDGMLTAGVVWTLNTIVEYFEKD